MPYPFRWLHKCFTQWGYISHVKAVMLCDMVKLWQLAMLHSGKERFLIAYKTFGFALYIVICFMLPAGDAEKLSHLFLNTWIFFLLQPGMSKSHSHTGWWIWPVICTTWTWYGNWRCSSISFPVRLLLLWQSLCRSLDFWWLLTSIWSWTPPPVVRYSRWHWHWSRLCYSSMWLT